MHSYVNIHTHHASADRGVFVFNNRFGYDPAYSLMSWFSIGIHPWDAGRIELDVETELATWLQHPNCFGVGECGLDKLRGPEMTLQQQIFDTQLTLARTYHKPVIIHCVKAFNELLEIAKPYLGNVPLIVHGFHKSEQLATQLAAKGFYISLSPALVLQARFDVACIPPGQLFLETDMSQEPIAAIYEAAALRLGMSTEALAHQINLNFERLKPKN